jgi:uncharacterized membrane protein YagU involved in acid resistance
MDQWSNAMNNVLAGAAVGAAATVPMTIFWEALHPRLPGEPPRPLPPREVAEALAVKFGVNRELDEIQMQWLALALHFGYGMLTGAVFGAIAPRRSGAAIGSGILFGLGVWASSYLGWLPASGVRHSPRWDPPARTALVVASHIVWGASAGLLLTGRGRREQASRRDRARA